MRSLRIFLLAAVIFTVTPAVAQPRAIRIPAPGSERDTRNEFYVKALELALSRSFSDLPEGYVLRRVNMPMTVQSRGIRALQAGRDVDVLWTMTTREREEALRPIRIPLAKGLMGWRLLLIRAEDQERFAQIQSIEQLRGHMAGQGENWPDVAVLNHHELPVMTGRSYDGLFRMLRKRRFDYFPRAITEIYEELETHARSGLVVENHLLLHYPAATYFFVNRSDEKLARHLEAGLREAIRDGSYDRLFMRMHGDLFQKARVAERTVLRLENPLLPRSAPLKEKELWLNPPGR